MIVDKQPLMLEEVLLRMTSLADLDPLVGAVSNSDVDGGI